MIWYIIRRLVLTVPTLIGVAIAVFFLIRVMPGDVVVVKLRADGASVSDEAIEAERKRLGLDKPLYQQFYEYMAGLPKLDLGKSLWTGEPVTKEIAIRMPVSFQIAIMAGLIAIAIAIPLGTISAVYRDTWIDHVVRVIAVSGLAIPSFWLGMLMIMALLTLFNWLPKIGYVPFWQDPLANLAVTIWPAASVGYRYAAVATRMMRSTLLEVMQEDYIRTARAKGVLPGLVVRRHAMKNAMLPVITVIGLEFAFLLGGLVVTEQVFNINGIGKLFVRAIEKGDFNMIQGLVLLIALVSIIANFVVDIMYGLFDPRIRQR